MNSNEFRQKIGSTSLKSTWFDVKKIREKFVFTGYGFGHGVGLCQWGAKYLASEKSYKYDKILSHYYPGTFLGSKENHSARANSYESLKINEPALLLSSFSKN